MYIINFNDNNYKYSYRFLTLQKCIQQLLSDGFSHNYYDKELNINYWKNGEILAELYEIK